jgi:hypothetical protein
MDWIGSAQFFDKNTRRLAQRLREGVYGRILREEEGQKNMRFCETNRIGLE